MIGTWSHLANPWVHPYSKGTSSHPEYDFRTWQPVHFWLRSLPFTLIFAWRHAPIHVQIPSNNQGYSGSALVPSIKVPKARPSLPGITLGICLLGNIVCSYLRQPYHQKHLNSDWWSDNGWNNLYPEDFFLFTQSFPVFTIQKCVDV